MIKQTPEQIALLTSRIKAAFMSIGFSEEDINTQLHQLNEVISVAVAARLIKDGLLSKEASAEEVSNYLEAHREDQEFMQLVEEEMVSVSTEYFNAIIESLSEEEKKQFFGKINADSVTQ